MRQIIDNLLYDTEKAEYIKTIKFPIGDIEREFDVYMTRNQRIFAYDKLNRYIISERKLTEFLATYAPDYYIKIYGPVEEA